MVAFRGASPTYQPQYVNGQGANVSLAVTIPACQPGDLLVAFISDAAQTTMPAGWTSPPVGGVTFDAPGVAYRTATGTDSGRTETWTARETYGAVTVVAYSSPSAGGLFDVQPVLGAAATGSTGAATAPMTPSRPVDLLIAFFHCTYGIPTPPAITPSGLTSRVLPAARSDNPFGGHHAIYDGTVPLGTNSTPAYQANANWASGAQAVSFLLVNQTPPYAPPLLTPANASTIDLAAGCTFTWQHADPEGDQQTAYAFRRKIAGAAAYEYWNAQTSAWQSNEIFNPTSSQSLTFTTGKWTNGNIYNWSVATRDALQTGSYATDATVTAGSTPQVTVTGPTGTITNTHRPTVTWTYAQAQGNPQQTWQVRLIEQAVYSAAGWDPTSSPGTATAAADSGQQISSTTSSYRPTVDLLDAGTYRAYVQVGQTGNLTSAWSYSGFTLQLVVPTVPTLTAVDDPVNGRVRLDVQGHDTGPDYTPNNTTFTIDYRDDPAADWTAVRGAVHLTPDATDHAVVYDYEAPPNTTRYYRARTEGSLS